jgi:hypothetical protein
VASKATQHCYVTAVDAALKIDKKAGKKAAAEDD